MVEGESLLGMMLAGVPWCEEIWMPYFLVYAVSFYVEVSRYCLRFSRKVVNGSDSMNLAEAGDFSLYTLSTSVVVDLTQVLQHHNPVTDLLSAPKSRTREECIHLTLLSEIDG
jgi:hypothetical protein